MKRLNPQALSPTAEPEPAVKKAAKPPVVAEKPVEQAAAPAVRPEVIPEFAIYTAAKNANIRSAPAAGSGRIGGLRQGENITVLGRVVGKNWVMVSTADERIGYVFAGSGSASGTTCLAAGAQSGKARGFKECGGQTSDRR